MLELLNDRSKVKMVDGFMDEVAEAEKNGTSWRWITSKLETQKIIDNYFSSGRISFCDNPEMLLLGFMFIEEDKLVYAFLPLCFLKLFINGKDIYASQEQVKRLNIAYSTKEEDDHNEWHKMLKEIIATAK